MLGKDSANRRDAQNILSSLVLPLPRVLWPCMCKFPLKGIPTLRGCWWCFEENKSDFGKEIQFKKGFSTSPKIPMQSDSAIPLCISPPCSPSLRLAQDQKQQEGELVPGGAHDWVKFHEVEAFFPTDFVQVLARAQPSFRRPGMVSVTLWKAAEVLRDTELKLKGVETSWKLQKG